MGEESLMEDDILMEQQDNVGSMITPPSRTESKENKMMMINNQSIIQQIQPGVTPPRNDEE